jgi:hypothetical protein
MTLSSYQSVNDRASKRNCENKLHKIKLGLRWHNILYEQHLPIFLKTYPYNYYESCVQ